MEDEQFDQLARESAAFPNRRVVLRGVAAILGSAGLIAGSDPDAEGRKSNSKKHKQKQRKKQKQRERKKDRAYECDYKDRVCATPTEPCRAVACENHKCVTSTMPNGADCGFGRQCNAGLCECPGGVCNSTVTPANFDGWALYNEQSNEPIAATFVTGPNTPPEGTGSAALETGGNSDKQMMSARLLNGTRLDELTKLTYWTYVHSSTWNTVPHFQIGITRNINDPKDFYEGRLVFSPLNAVVFDTWQEWDLLNYPTGSFFLSPGDYPPVTVCTQGIRCTFAEVLDEYPDIAINPTGPSPDNDGSGWGFIGVMVGSGEGTVDANFDAITIEIPGSQYNFNFDPNS